MMSSVKADEAEEPPSRRFSQTMCTHLIRSGQGIAKKVAPRFIYLGREGRALYEAEVARGQVCIHRDQQRPLLLPGGRIKGWPVAFSAGQMSGSPRFASPLPTHRQTYVNSCPWSSFISSRDCADCP
jgi:hypothetical protein